MRENRTSGLTRGGASAPPTLLVPPRSIAPAVERKDPAPPEEFRDNFPATDHQPPKIRTDRYTLFSLPSHPNAGSKFKNPCKNRNSSPLPQNYHAIPGHY
jgi:hypothetical protein